MKKLFTLCLLALSTIGLAWAQDCTGGRYTQYDLFSDVDVTSGVTFGSNSGTTLKMDVYQPTGDTETDRAVVIVAFGGSFISGARTDASVVYLCEMFAKMGYVAVAPDYRRGFFFPINEVSTTTAVLKCMHDLKAAVRFMKKSANEDGNPYGIDCERIVVGGISAGAIGAVHVAYMDKLSEVPAYMVNDTAGLGGVEGISGTPGYPSDPVGVFSFSGAIGDTSWIEAGDVGIVSIHEELDNVVPYGTQEVAVSGFPTGLIASGSGDLHIRASNLGMNNSLKTYPGVNNHVGYMTPVVDQAAMDFATSFLADLVCAGNTNSCTQLSSNITEIEQNSIALYPNPATDILNFISEEAGMAEIIDATGRTVMMYAAKQGQNMVNIAELPSGAYLLKISTEHIGTGRFIKH